MELSNLKVGMKVKITSDTTLLGLGKEKEHKNEVVTVYKIVNGWIYVKENNFVWLPIQLEPITETKTVDKFVVRIKSEEEGVVVLNRFKYSESTDLTATIRSYTNYYCKENTEDKRTVGIAVENNSFVGWANIDFYKRHESEFGKIYTLADIVKKIRETNAEIKEYNTKEEKTMEKKTNTKAKANNVPARKTFKDFIVKTETIERWVKATTIGATPVQDENGKTKGYKKPFVITTVTTDKGEATVEHTPTNSNEKDAIMYALAKITAKKDSTTKMLYELANSCVVGSAQIYTILANHAVRNGDFNKAYEKYKAIKAYNYAIDCRCKTCGKQFDTPEEAREHEKWHALNRKAKHERYLIRREAREKIAEAQHNEAVAAEIKKLMETE